MRKKIWAMLSIALILLTTLASISVNSPAAYASDAALTGNIYDYGSDTDGDGLFNFLVVEVEVNVSVASYYTVEVHGLMDASYNYYWIYSSNTIHLDIGVHNVSVSLSGIRIYGYRFNPKEVYGIYLYDEYHQTLDYRGYIDLSQTYTYTMFDTGAVLTGKIYDKGIDTDADGLYNYLEVGVEINVSDAARYQVYVSELVNTSYYYIYNVYNSTEDYLSSGIQVLNVSLYGAPIYASHATNIFMVNVIYLSILDDYGSYQLDYKYDLNLINLYNYSEFESPAYFTGTIYDRGVDADLNSKYDYLEISVEINFTEAGNYEVEVQSLVDYASHYLSIYQSVSGYFDVGVQLVNITVYGPYLYAQHFSPRYIGSMDIYSLQPWLVLDELSNLPLPTLYTYTDFESHAFLTGNISDRGVDTDGDGLFDYLEIGIEINVTEAGRYGVWFSSLMEQTDSTYNYLYVYQYVEAEFTEGVHTVYLNCAGSQLAYEHFSPTNVSDIYLFETTSPYTQLGYIQSASLSKKYDYTLFNTPLKDAQLNFLVYPNGTVGVDGTFNFTHMYPQNTGPQMNTTLSVSTTGETTTGSAKGTAVFPEDGMFGWPFDSTTANFASQYNSGLLNATLDATLFMPPEASTTYPTNTSDFSFSSTYSNGLFNAELWAETEIPLYYHLIPFYYNSMPLSPLNITDFTVLADYIGNEIKGNITFHTVPGFTLGDIRVDFNGNKTDLHLTGNVNVTYGNFFGIEINSTTLDEMLAQLNDTIPGPTGLVYNATMGLLECTQLSTTKVDWSDGFNGTDIMYDATIHGNFTGFFARILAQMISPYYVEEAYPTVYAALDSALSTANASLILTYYHISGIATLDLRLASDVKALWTKALELVPPTLPPTMSPEYKTQIEALLKIANATAYAINNFSLDASYSSTAQRLDLDAWLLANITQLKDDILPIVPDTMPSPLREIVESYMNTTYCTLTSSNATFSYVNRTANFETTWILQGDYEAQINHMKRFYIDYLNATTPWMVSWQFSVLNATEININNMEVEVKLGKDWMYATFNGLILQPPKDEIDSVRFKLYKFFNTSSDPYESPRQFEKLKITIRGGANATHTVLLYTPDTMTSSDECALNYTSMTWENTTISSMRDLVFKIAYQGIVNYLGKTYYVPVFTNSTVSNFQFNPGSKSISFNVTGATGTGFSEITIPRALLNAALGEWIVKLDGTPLPSENFTVTENAEYVFINLNYTHSEHLIEIVGTSIVTEFQPNTFLLILAALSLIVALVAVKKRKKLGAIRTKYQSAIHAFTDKLHQLRA
jgi:hypothetical protein